MGVCFPMDRCKDNNGGCEQLCSSENGQAICSCRYAAISPNPECRMLLHAYFAHIVFLCLSHAVEAMVNLFGIAKNHMHGVPGRG
jgi:hypothetical protein